MDDIHNLLVKTCGEEKDIAQIVCAINDTALTKEDYMSILCYAEEWDSEILQRMVFDRIEKEIDDSGTQEVSWCLVDLIPIIIENHAVIKNYQDIIPLIEKLYCHFRKKPKKAEPKRKKYANHPDLAMAILYSAYKHDSTLFDRMILQKGQKKFLKENLYS